MLPIWLTDTVTSDLDRAIHYTLLWGLDGVELRTVDGKTRRVPFVNEEKLLRRIDESELELGAIVPGLCEGMLSDYAGVLNEELEFEDTLQFCDRVSCRIVVASSFQQEDGFSLEKAAEAFHRLGRRAAAHGVTIAVQNEAGMAIETGERLAALIEAVGLPSVRASWHPSVALQAGEEPATGLKALAGSIAHVRMADVQQVKRTWLPVQIGRGSVGWNKVVQALTDTGFDGPVSLEVHEEPKAKTGLADATTLISLIRKARRR